MINDITKRDEMKAVERWENEGGRVSPINSLWASLKSFTTKDNSREAQVIDARTGAADGKVEADLGLAETKYVVLSDDGLTKPQSQRWREMLRRWLVQCPNCAEVRLVVGARENERYVCQDCGHSFTIRRSVAADTNLSN